MALVFLEDFLELVEELPTEMKQRFTELRRMDSLYQGYLQKGEEKQSEFFKNANAKSQSKSNLQEMCQPIIKEYHHARKVLKDKRALVKSTQEMMSRILNHLELQLKEYEQELESQSPGTVESLRERSAVLDSEDIPYHEYPVKGGRLPHKLSVRTSQRSSSLPNKKKKIAAVSTTPLPTPPTPAVVEDESPGEVFCYCKQGSYGEMIGCDNDKCPIEWFHYTCVGLTSAPQGSWFCPECRKKKKKK
eukprot:m.106137 g.106137  ORF g.106137 m.106137 type:complete len:247 (+) comp9147_c3_seq1:106-846(+)